MIRSYRWLLVGGAAIALAAVLGTRAFRSLSAAGTPARAVVRRCEECHAAIAGAYQKVGMAHSYRSLDAADPVVPGDLLHKRSGRYYRVFRRGERMVQRRHEIDVSGTEANVFELEATHAIGSGNHARTYFHRTEAGELIELPLTWYSQEQRWALSPGFDEDSPPDFTRRADDGCLFCHSGAPRSATSAGGSIGCDRCHGDGERHAAIASRGGKFEQLRAAIVNPRRLSSSLQMDICMQCHLETTSVELPQMLRRFDRDVFSFRPGEPLGAYVVHFDAGSGRDRFEIVNQAYRLRQSACFRNSSGRMTCSTCHDPHNVPRGPAAVTSYRAKCVGCHAALNAPGHPDTGSADCASCHMPKRRTEDAVHVVMTDHLIARRPPRTVTPVAPERERTFPGELSIYHPQLTGPEHDLYLGAALIIGGRDRARGITLLDRVIESAPNGKALAVLAEGRMAGEDFAGAVREFRRALDRGPSTARLHYNLAQALDAAGQPSEAEREFEEALRMDPNFPEAHYAYGNHLATARDFSGAERQYSAAVLVRPVYAEAHNNLGNILAERKDLAGARSHFEQAIQIDPGFAEAHDNEARVLAAEGRLDDALSHGRRAVKLKPGLPEAHYNLGRVLQERGSAPAAIAEYRTALRLRPSFIAAHLGLGASLADSGSLDAAIAECRAALSIDPQNTIARDFLDRAMRARGR